MPGTQLITVIASNLVGLVKDSHGITIADIPISGLFLRDVDVEAGTS